MYRLFGFVANKEVDVCFSMHKANNSFEDMGQRNPGGCVLAGMINLVLI